MALLCTGKAPSYHVCLVHSQASDRNYMSLDGLQTFCPTDCISYDSGSVPLEVLLDYRCESNSFDRIVPQTNANCQYDRFNRLRLRNIIASPALPRSEHVNKGRQAHLQNDTVEYPTRSWYTFLTRRDSGLSASPCSPLHGNGERSTFPVYFQHHHSASSLFGCRPQSTAGKAGDIALCIRLHGFKVCR